MSQVAYSLIKILFSIVIIILLTMVWMNARNYLLASSLSEKKLRAYETVISFAMEKERDNFNIVNDGWIVLPSSVEITSKKDEERIKLLGNLLKENSTMMAYKEGEFIFFRLNKQLPLMKTPGYIYSISGDDPRKMHDYRLDLAKPIYPIKGKWYYSHNMIISAQ